MLAVFRPKLITWDKKGSVRLGWFEYVLQALILLSLFTFAAESLPDLTAREKAWLKHFETFSIFVFTIEYLTRLILTRPSRKYLFSFFGVIDLVSILPFYVGLGTDWGSLRAFRLLRLFRIFKLARYNAAAQRFQRAFMLAREELILFGTTCCVLLYVSGVGIYFLEHDAQPKVFRSIFDGLWWALETLTTVGYGDVAPITAGGRSFTFIVLLIGLGIIAVPVGLLASALSSVRAEEEEEAAAEKKQERP